jgi:hypothetical protein
MTRTPAVLLFSLLQIGLMGGQTDHSTDKKQAAAIESGTKSATDSASVNDLLFAQFVKKFPRLGLPLTIKTLDIQSDALQKITGRDSMFTSSSDPEGTRAYGLLPDTTGNFKLIWLSPADVYVPILTTFNRHGQRISETHLSVGACGSDCCYSCAEYITINKDMTIYSVDSIKSCDCDSAGPQEKTMKKYTRFMTGAIAADGKISMSDIKEKTETIPGQ